jgi:hypothetical protein
MIDGFEEVHPLVQKIIVDGYQESQAKARWAYSFLYACNKIRIIARISQKLVALAVQ